MFYSVGRLVTTPPYVTVLLFAKNKAAAAALSDQFQRRRVHNYYVALSARKPSNKMGTVIGELTKGRKGAYRLNNLSTIGGDGGAAVGGMGKGRKGRKKQGSVNDKGSGKKKGKGGGVEAVTRFVSRSVSGASHPDHASERRLRLLVMKPATHCHTAHNTPHQLRVTCKSLGAPVLGDDVYAGAKAKSEDRVYLHAAAIRIRLPSLSLACAPGPVADREGLEGGGEDEGCAAEGGESPCVDSDASTDSCTAGRVIQIVCMPGEGREWCTEAFAEAWGDAGFRDVEEGARQWFPDHKLLGSSLDDLLAEERQDEEEVLTVVDGGAIAVSWDRRRTPVRLD